MHSWKRIDDGEYQRADQSGRVDIHLVQSGCRGSWVAWLGLPGRRFPVMRTLSPQGTDSAMNAAAGELERMLANPL